MTNDVKGSFFMLEFSSNKIVNHRSHINNDKGGSGIKYDMIIGCGLMVQIGLMANFKHQVLQLDGTTVHMKEHSGLLGQSYLTKCEMCEVVMHTAEPSSRQEATERTVKSSTVAI